ncbi:MAG: hypothetical protein AAB499_01780 [Patescibacteria group bacterium]
MAEEPIILTGEELTALDERRRGRSILGLADSTATFGPLKLLADQYHYLLLVDRRTTLGSPNLAALQEQLTKSGATIVIGRLSAGGQGLLDGYFDYPHSYLRRASQRTDHHGRRFSWLPAAPVIINSDFIQNQSDSWPLTSALAQTTALHWEFDRSLLAHFRRPLSFRDYWRLTQESQEAGLSRSGVLWGDCLFWLVVIWLMIYYWPLISLILVVWLTFLTVDFIAALITRRSWLIKFLPLFPLLQFLTVTGLLLSRSNRLQPFRAKIV